MTEAIVVLVTTPTPERAAEIARAVVEERLAACGNVVPGLRSIYRWEGKVEDEPEALLVVKTTAGRFERLRERVLAMHPSACPEIVAVPSALGHAPYLEWLVGSVETPRRSARPARGRRRSRGA